MLEASGGLVVILKSARRWLKRPLYRPRPGGGRGGVVRVGLAACRCFALWSGDKPEDPDVGVYVVSWM